MYWSKQSKTLLALAVAAAINVPLYVYAAEKELSDEAITQEYQLDDVVVTASRTEQLLEDTPASVEVITREDIENMGAESLEQALALTLGLSTLANGMVGNEVQIRGAKTNQTLILIDGRRVRTENGSSTTNYYELQRVNMDNVERIEIVRGAVSSLYGSEAMGGVINIITKRPEKMRTTLSADWTSKLSDFGVVQDFGRNGKWSLKTSAHVTNFRKKVEAGESNNFGEKYYFNIDGRYHINDRKNLDIFFDYLKEDLEGFSGTTQRDYYDHARTSLGASYNGVDNKGDYEVRFYYTNLIKDQNIRRNGALVDFDKMEFNSYIFDGKRSLELNKEHYLTFGGEYRIEDYEGTRVDDGSGTTALIREGVSKNYGTSNLYYGAVYLQDEWTPNRRLIILPSVRWDYNNEFGSEVTAKFGSTYKMSDNARLKFNIGSAYRAPTASELYMSMTRRPSATRIVRIIGNPDLNPEKALNFDVSLEAERGRTSGKLTYFHNKIDDMIGSRSTRVVSGGVTTTTTRYININEAVLQGIELEAKQKLNDKFAVRTTYTYLDAVDGFGVRIPDRARHTASLQLNYNDSKHGINATLWHDWLSDYGYDETVGSGSAAKTYHRKTSGKLLNFVINKKFNESFSAYFGINNILDEDNDTLNYDSRTWRGGVRWTF